MVYLYLLVLRRFGSAIVICREAAVRRKQTNNIEIFHSLFIKVQRGRTKMAGTSFGLDAIQVQY